MKVCFIAPSSEAGAGGVADYTLMLANDLRLRGVPSDGCNLKQAIDLERSGHRYDWVSLQVSPFGYHRRGLLWRLARDLSVVRPCIGWHIMFHELWLGLDSTAPLKHRMLGWLQKQGIRRLIRQLQPTVVHTQAGPYVDALESVGVNALKLPLFGNIPHELEEKSGNSGEINTDHFNVVLFGTIHPEWSPETIFPMLIEFCELYSRTLRIHILGKHGKSVDWMRRLKQQWSQQLEIIESGFLSSAAISKNLQQMQLGIATTPLNLIEKSSTAISMHEHGMPVVITRNDFNYGRRLNRKDWMHTEWLLPDEISVSRIAELKRFPAKRLLTDVTNQFIRDLKLI